MHLNLIVHILSHALGTIGRYSVLSFHISIVFDINPLELVRFWNYRYFLVRVRFRVRFYRLCFCFRISNVKVENNLGVFRPLPTGF